MPSDHPHPRADPRPRAVFLMGPTASGKTALALELVERFPFEIISVDSALVYRGMDIGTAKPAADVRARVPHRLIDIRDPVQSYSAGSFRTDALREMAAIVAAGRMPLLVGGTMLYFRALQQGLACLPSANPQVRAALDARAAVEGWAALHAELASVDPEAARRIHPNDPQRIQRALEVFALTGRALSELFPRLHAEQFPYRVVKVGLIPHDRPALHRRIALRFEQMLGRGFIEEVECLRARGDLHMDLPSMRAVGYRQVWEYLEGQRNHAQMLERVVTATRQLAKRQMTWLRSEPATWEAQVFDPHAQQGVVARLMDELG